MVKYPTILKLPQKDINRQFYQMILDLQKEEDTDVSTLENAIDTLETTVGGSTSGLVKDVTTLKTTVGGADSGLVKGVSDITTAIGDEETANTILYRIKALEDAQG